MRLVFTSRRLETVEGVEKLLQEAGIETRIMNGRSYKGTHRHAFSYRDDPKKPNEPQPELWVVRTDDLPRARQVLFDAGLLDLSARPGYSSLTFRADSTEAPKAVTPLQRANRLRLILLVACVLAAGWVTLMR